MHSGEIEDRPLEAGDRDGAAPPSPRSPALPEENIPDDAPDEDASADDYAHAPQFDDQLRLIFEEAFPIFMDRIRRASFADWHRRRGRELDLAQEALAAVMRHCRDTRCIPANVVGYLVATARNIAISDWRKRRQEPFLFADLDTIRTKPGTRGTGRITTPEDDDPFKESPEGTARRGDEVRSASEPRQPGNAERGTDTGQEEQEPNTPEAQIPAGPAETTADHEQVRAAVEALPRRQREAIQIYMHCSEEHTTAQMAAMMRPAISADGFEKNIERAMKRLRQALATTRITDRPDRRPESVGLHTPNGVGRKNSKDSQGEHK